MITTLGFRTRALARLQAAGLPTTTVAAGNWALTFLDAICSSFSQFWALSYTLPANGPLPFPPPTQPHLHVISPGTFIPAGLIAAITASCPQFDPAYGWAKLRDAWATKLCLYVPTWPTDIRDGNDLTHVHLWMPLNPSVLASAIKDQIRQTIGSSVDNTHSSILVWVDCVCAALADTVEFDGSTGLPIVSGTTHNHILV